MNVFDQLNDIIVRKDNDRAKSFEEEDEYVPFLLQRWLSMYSTSYAEIVNVSSNRLWKIMEDKQMWNKFFISVIPRGVEKRIRYIKKPTKSSKKGPDAELIQFLSESLEVSQREIKSYIEAGAVDLKQLKKQLNM